MATVTRYTRLTNWVRSEAGAIGSTDGMAHEPLMRTILGGRSATVEVWLDETTGNGWERQTITLHDWEA